LKKRVVVTGMAGITPFGRSWRDVGPRLRQLKNAVVRMSEWDQFEGLNTRLAAPVADFQLPEGYPRKKTRSMGRVAQFATVATELALKQANLLEDPVLSSGETGVAYGSSTGSPDAIRAFRALLEDKKVKDVNANTYLQMMSHTTAVNVSLFFGLRGRLIPSSSACTSGSQAIGFAYETIQHGYQKIMVAGGGEELSVTEAAVFDTMYATSRVNDHPETSPRPFDAARDGLVIGEGAATLVLEELEHAKGRGAPILAELVGFSSNCDATHITQPNVEVMQVCLASALRQAGLDAGAIGYVNAHGTATDQGDVAESMATNRVLGPRMPISTLKSYFGHTLGACGAIEAWLAIEMMNEEWFAPTINLDQIDPRCAELDYIVGSGRNLDIEYMMTNNFAFGGVNTSLIFRRLAT
jgi:3-oxoacyl-[acyl-carrier-protein] synthase II